MIDIERQLKEFIGMNYNEVIQTMKENNITHRIVKNNEEHYVVTQDIIFNRLNITLENNIITNIYLG